MCGAGVSPSWKCSSQCQRRRQLWCRLSQSPKVSSRRKSNRPGWVCSGETEARSHETLQKESIWTTSSMTPKRERCTSSQAQPHWKSVSTPLTHWTSPTSLDLASTCLGTLTVSLGMDQAYPCLPKQSSSLLPLLVPLQVQRTWQLLSLNIFLTLQSVFVEVSKTSQSHRHSSTVASSPTLCS